MRSVKAPRRAAKKGCRLNRSLCARKKKAQKRLKSQLSTWHSCVVQTPPSSNKKKPFTIPAIPAKKMLTKCSRNGAYVKKNLAEELVLEIVRSADSSDEEMPMKCSLDSGISMVASPVKGSSLTSVSLEQSVSLDSGIGSTRFAKSVAELVEHVSKKRGKKSASTGPDPKARVKTVTEVEQRQSQTSLNGAPLVLERVTPFEQRVEPSEKSRIYKLLPRDIEFCTYMLEKYGDNFQAMSEDYRNIYMDDARNIARKLRIFRESPHYQEYLGSKA